MRRSHRLIFEAVLLTFPGHFRARFAEQMRDSFEAGYLDAEARGPGFPSQFVLRTMADMAAASVGEWTRPSQRRSRRRRRQSPWPDRAVAVAQDFRFALRSLRRRPAAVAIPVVILALGIGANTAIFSVVDAVLLSPLPYEDPDALVTVSVEMADGRPGFMSYPDIADVAGGSEALTSLLGHRTRPMALSGLDGPRVTTVAMVTAGLMELFGTKPLYGRDIRADEFGPHAPHTVVLSHAVWSTRFGSDPGVVGDSLRLNGELYEVVGVAPASFGFPVDAELWIPRRIDLERCGRRCYTMWTVGRLSPRSTVESLREEIDRLEVELATAYPESNEGRRFVVRTMEDQVVGDVRAGLWLTLGSVGVVLLIACANVANLLLVRASERASEVALRSALGASRLRLIRQLFLESAVIASAGGLAGLLLASVALRVLPDISAGGIPRIEEIAIDRPVLLFTCASVLLVTILFGTLPAIVGTGGPSRAVLRSGRTGRKCGRGVRRPGGLLVGAEVAMSALLLIAAGLLFRSFEELYAVDVGFETHRVTRFDLDLPRSRYPSLEQVRSFYREFEDRVRSIPGVESVGSMSGPPLRGKRESARILRKGYPDPNPSDETRALVHAVGPGWLETMRIAVLHGRGLTVEDDYSDDPVAVVSETFVRDNFGSQDPIGQTFRVPLNLGFGSPTWRIVGVVSDIRSRGLRVATAAAIYVPHGQYGPGRLTVAVRSRMETSGLVEAVRGQVRAVDGELPLYNVYTMEELVDLEVAPTRFYLVLVGLFAGLALVLAAVGLYGVVSYVASRRTHEIGLRVALGSRQSGVIRLVVGHGLRPAAVGLALGLALALLGGHMLEGVLFGVRPSDPVVFGATTLVLGLVSTLACVVPALRAATLDPGRALRFD